MRFWGRSSRLTKDSIEAGSLAVVAGSLDVTEADRLAGTLAERSEADRLFGDAEGVTDLEIENFDVGFEWLFDDLVIWCVCDFYFSLYQAMSQRLKKWLL